MVLDDVSNLWLFNISKNHLLKKMKPQNKLIKWKDAAKQLVKVIFSNIEFMKQSTGIEPASSDWKSEILTIVLRLQKVVFLQSLIFIFLETLLRSDFNECSLNTGDGIWTHKAWCLRPLPMPIRVLRQKTINQSSELYAILNKSSRLISFDGFLYT